MKPYRTLFHLLAASFALTAASIATPLTAQTGIPGGPGTGTHVPGYSFPYGQGCGSSLMGPVDLVLTTVPEIDTDAIYTLSNGVPGNPAWLMLGFVPLNLDLTPIGAWGCHLYVDPLVALPKQITAVGTADFAVPIPDNPALIGVHFFAQALAVDAMANAAGFVLTNGIEASIGGTL